MILIVFSFPTVPQSDHHEKMLRGFLPGYFNAKLGSRSRSSRAPRCGLRALASRLGFGKSLLGGSWVVINGDISRVTIHIRGLITPLITTREPPSSEDRQFEEV